MDPPQPSSSKYFKPGFIFNKKPKIEPNPETLLDDDDLDCDDIDEIISQASQKQPQRLDQLESQPVDFRAAKKPVSVPSLKGTNTILIDSTQKENPLLKYLRTVRYVVNELISPAHYVLYDSCCALFLQLSYHVTRPDFIYDRVAELRNKYQLCLLILLIENTGNYEKHLKELTIMATRTNFTLLMARSFEDAAKHIENFCINAEKSPDIIMGPKFDETLNKKKTSNNDAIQQCLVNALTTVKSINRTDAVTLLSTFDTLENVINADEDELYLCPGISMVKTKRLKAIFNKPFIKKDEDRINE